MPKHSYTFPAGFLWGAATSAHQVEGNNIHSDWWAWEQQGRRGEERRSGTACNQWYLYPQDFALAKELGHNAHRFSLEWAKIEPQEGQFDESALNHYEKVFQELGKNHLLPFVSLHHFTNPQWFTLKGGWEKAANVEYYLRYVEKVIQRFGCYANFWLTINEPLIYAFLGWVFQKWPPRKKSLKLALSIINHQISAHNQAYDLIHRIQKEKNIQTYVGLAKNYIYILPYRGPVDWGLAKGLDYAWNHYFIQRTRACSDFLGVNYYFSNQVDFIPNFPYYRVVDLGRERSDLGWEIAPEGLREGLVRLKKYHLPIYITENGLADARDEKRAEFIRSHLKSVGEALEAGVDVRGYFHWSLIDNYEWAEGIGPRFGLVDIDYQTQKRTVRPSAYFYKKICQTNQLPL